MLSEGQVLDDTYRLLRRVGEGAMGVVYEATHARLAGRYAIKVLAQQLAESPAALAHFDREARITSLLQHPNVVQVIDHNTAADGTEYLVMEYLAGESLAQRLAREGRLSLDAVVGIVDQIAAGLSAAHAHGIVHRDLKPDNVILVPVEGRETELCKILDFGISKRRGSLAASGMELCGTPQYMAPEQAEGRLADVDGATDQFALAVIAQEMLTGRNPFQGDDVGIIFWRISSDSPMSVGLGQDLDAVLARALAKSNRERFGSVTEFSEAFRAAALGRQRDQRLEAVPPTNSRGTDLERKRKARRRNLTVALGATVATILTLPLVAGRSPNHLTVGRHAGSPLVARQEKQPVPEVGPPVIQQIVEPQVTAPVASGQSPRPTEGGGYVVARTRHLPPVHPTSPPRTLRPRSVLPVDEDATMPLTGLWGREANH